MGIVLSNPLLKSSVMKKNIVLVLLALCPLLGISQALLGIDEIAPFNEEMAAIRKGEQWGFINREGVLVIEFRNDLVWDKNADTLKSGINGIRFPSFHNGRCLVSKLVDEIQVYGFIDTTGKLVIEHQFLNVSSFNKGYTVGIIYEKVFIGKNEIKLDVYRHKFHEVLMDSSGEIIEFLSSRDNIQMTKKRYIRPSINAKFISQNLIVLRAKDRSWEIRKLDL